MNIIEKIFGTHSENELKRIYPIVDRIEALGPEMEALSDEELRGKTKEFKERLKEGETLDDILPEAYAVVREGAYRSLGMRHYRVQLIGGIILHQGRIAEMRTGEGKTLVSTLPAYLNALDGKGVHIVTVNDYLAKRDAEWMGKVHEFLGLKVGVVLNEMNNDERREAYNCDITYVTNNELGFDYLRDNMVIYKEQLVQRGLHYAVIDEVDSVLIDEARTPLIISGQSGKSTALYEACDVLAKQLERGEASGEFSKMNAIMGEEIEETGDFIVDEKEKTVNLTEDGVKKVEKFFHIENLADPENLEIQHNIILALRAHNLMFRDQDYVVTPDGEVMIVDEFTGRIMPGRRYSDGLHQAIEAKEHVKVRRESKTLATITFQNLFNKYDKKSGMTGTAITEEKEFRDIYGMDVVEIPTNKPVQRVDLEDAVYKTKKEKYEAVVEAVKEAHATGQPVLVGTITIEVSELLSKMLKKEGIKHNVLNAKYHEQEAAIVADAGLHGAVTIATNMAGRGTDIKLSPEVKAAGGLAIIGTERHESRRVDRQLRGRSGRQGDPGSSVFYVSLEDNLMRLFANERIARVMDKLGFKDGEMIEHSMITRSIENAQKKVEENHFGVRKRLLEYDDVMNKQRTVVYEKRHHALMGERLGMDISDMIWDRVCNVIENNDWEGCRQCFLEIFAMEVPFTAEQKETMNPDDLAEEAYQKVLERFRQKNEVMAANANKVVTMIYESPEGQNYEMIGVPVIAGQHQYGIRVNLKEAYESHSESVVTAFHKTLLLHTIDEAWMENLRLLDELKHSVQNASYEQKDPLLIFKLESVKLFDEMVNRINDRSVSIMMRAMIPELRPRTEADEMPQQAPAPQQRPRLQESRGEEASAAQRAAAARDTRDRQPVQPARAEKLPGRNDLCPCGSGLKFKNCHGRNL